MITRTFQITEDDLAVLESALPLIYAEGSNNEIMNQRPDLREGWTMTKQILSNVRWGYGPHEQVTTIAGGES